MDNPNRQAELFKQFDAIAGTKTPTTTSGTPTRSRADEIRAIQPKSLEPVDDIATPPTYKASIGGAETVLPNVAKTIGNIPSNAKNLIGETIVRPAENIGKSRELIGDIYKDRGAIQGTKDIAGGFVDTYKSIGESAQKSYDQNDLINHLAPIQESTVKMRDEALDEYYQAKKEGKDTDRILKRVNILQNNLNSIDEKIGSKADRDNKDIKDLTDIAKYPIERPLDVPAAMYGGEAATGKDIIETAAQKVTGGADTSLANIANKGKELISPVVDPIVNKLTATTRSGEKAFNEALELSRPAVTDAIEQEAISEGRVGKQGKIKGATIAPNAQEVRQAESLQPLIEDGRVSAKMFKKDPTQVQKIIEQEVSRTNEGVTNLVHDPKYDLPITNNELDSVIQAAKAKNRILFGGDKAIERAYDTVIEEFKTNFLKKQTTGGVFDARQEFGAYIRKNFPKAFQDEILTGSVNPRAQALRDIYSAANEIVANKLDSITVSRALKTLEPKVAKGLIAKARSFENKEDFITWAKKNMDQFPESEFASGSARKQQAKMNTVNQYPTREEDLGELWDISRTNIVSGTGELYTNMLRREADLLNITKKNIPTKLKDITRKGKISSAIDKVYGKPLVKTIGAVATGAAVLYGGAKAVKAATD